MQASLAQHDDLGADFGAVIEINHVIVDHADATR
jgi:hypothetical protein